ncbi:MAG: peptidylprolyl isomerase [Pirellulales bacterium]|nr:peptidylprolyl isomerase [Pirellulales bacterium]
MARKTSGTTISRASAWKKRLGFLFGAIVVVAICVAIRHLGGGPEKADAVPPEQPRTQNYPVRQATASLPAQSSASAPTSMRSAAQPGGPSTGSARKSGSLGNPPKRLVTQVAAEVNGRKITRDELARNCLLHYGDEVMETIRNKYLIELACRKHNIAIGRGEVDAEIERLASRFKLPVDQWLKLLRQERGVSGDQYAEEIIWPTLALRKLAGSRTQVTREEIVREYEIMYGKQIRARLIAMENPQEAEAVRADAAAHAADAEYFGALAMKHSVDAPSAAAKGVIQPILRHGTYPEIEQAAFGMEVGAVSPVIKVSKSEQYVILRKEGEIPNRNVKLDELLARKLEEIVRDRKLRTAANDIFKELRENAKIEDVWNDPVKHKQMPDVAALIDGRPIPMPEFVKACLDRHGEEVLEGMIGRALIEIEAQKMKIDVSSAELDAEVARSAALELKPLPDGSPDVENFKKMIAQEQHVKFDVYLHDAVWPAVALRKLAEPNVKVTEQELKKGFAANYGPRVRCLAIVLNNQRRANDVWELARKKNTSDYFGDLAAEYSIEPGSQALRGEVPPIKKNGGQPQLEEEAFKLKPGELSGVIQVLDKFVILRCEGYTEPVQVDFAQVKSEIKSDLYEKLLRVEMARYFGFIQDKATIDNYLTGTSRAPNRRQLGGPEEANAATARQVPSVYQQPRTK